MQIKRLTFISVTRAIACATMLSYFTAAPVHAEEVKAGDLVITQAWSRATPGGAKIGVVCFRDPDGTILELISGM